MTRDPLRELLTRADAAADVATQRPAADVAGRIRDEARRRRARARVASAVMSTAAVLLVAALLLPSLRRQPDFATSLPSHGPVESGPPTAAADVAELKATLVRLRTEAESRELAVAAMLQREAAARRPAATGQATDPLEWIRAQQDLSALAIVRQADRRYHELDRRDAAAAAYGRVVALFPSTHAAAVARQRLSDIGG